MIFVLVGSVPLVRLWCSESVRLYDGATVVLVTSSLFAKTASGEYPADTIERNVALKAMKDDATFIVEISK